MQLKIHIVNFASFTNVQKVKVTL